MVNLKFISKIIFFLPLIVLPQSGGNIELQNLAPPTSPAFVLMDVSPSNIIVPENIQAFSIQTFNTLIGDSKDGLTNNNYAVEFQPYWYYNRTNMNFFEYNNLTSKQPLGSRTLDDYDGYNVMGNIWKNLSISAAFLNGTFEVFNNPQSYISIGAKTRLLTFRTEDDINNLKTRYRAYEQFMSSAAVIAIIKQGAQQGLSLSEINKSIEKLNGWKNVQDNMSTAIQKKPLFALDVAIAYSHFLGDKSQNIDDSLGRFGIWTSGDLALNLPFIDKNSYFHIYGVYRYLRDGLNLDSVTNTRFIKNINEYGGKLEFEIKQLAFAYEYISRNNGDESRSIGTIRYKINDSFTLNGGFGENFESNGNSIALLGIQWGLDYKAAVNPVSK